MFKRTTRIRRNTQSQWIISREGRWSGCCSCSLGTTMCRRQEGSCEL